ncbi:hypothetical protein FW774_17235 [Pedobacter sp. BS3]|uniref:hypothetical protein n=1 Tax=Pedobacter sp. BS3 TaxID=2567937 RepID=UPI0011EFFB0A|nr:hypothetical protein [Pedobacter sp. BS3]TZF81800.1 hypothetical protein FW774_17235 [Pedobacter sp. BS3]
MPINYKEYHPKWKLISKLIRVNRAKGKCEWCGIKNGSVVKRNADGTFREPCQTDWDMIHSRIKHSHSNMTESLKYHGFSKIVLTVAHIDHDKTNNRFNNLAALCQKCHLSHDLKQHVDNRKYGRNWKGEHQLRMSL